MKVLVTGSTGFIGSAFIRRALKDTDWSFVAFARNSDQRNKNRLSPAVFSECHIPYDSRTHIVFGDLNGDLSGLCEGIDVVINFAARTFVDHSIKDAAPFVESNVLGTMHLLEDARRNKVKRFYQISTDEVYGAILNGAYKEDAPICPTNPYAASKAGADALAIAFAHTYGMHTTVTRTENNYGPYQHPQKVFPTFVGKALRGEKLPIYGDGLHVRQWLYVDDHVDALIHLIRTEYEPGQVFHIAGNQELTNIDLAKRIIYALREKYPTGYFSLSDKHKKTRYFDNFDDLVEFIPDHNIRPGHDRRYALDCSKLRGLGWTPKVGLTEGIQRVTSWYCDHLDWIS